MLGMPVVFLDVGLKNTTNIGRRIERGLVVMGCVVDLVRGVLASIMGPTRRPNTLRYVRRGNNSLCYTRVKGGISGHKKTKRVTQYVSPGRWVV